MPRSAANPSEFLAESLARHVSSLVSAHDLMQITGRVEAASLDWPSTFRVIILLLIETSAHCIASHHPGIVGLQHFQQRVHILHSGIEPEIVIKSVKDDRHAVIVAQLLALEQLLATAPVMRDTALRALAYTQS